MYEDGITQLRPDLQYFLREATKKIPIAYEMARSVEKIGERMDTLGINQPLLLNCLKQVAQEIRLFIDGTVDTEQILGKGHDNQASILRNLSVDRPVEAIAQFQVYSQDQEGSARRRQYFFQLVVNWSPSIAKAELPALSYSLLIQDANAQHGTSFHIGQFELDINMTQGIFQVSAASSLSARPYEEEIAEVIKMTKSPYINPHLSSFALHVDKSSWVKKDF